MSGVRGERGGRARADRRAHPRLWELSPHLLLGGCSFPGRVICPPKVGSVCDAGSRTLSSPPFLSHFRVGPGLPGASRACPGRGAGGCVELERERGEGRVHAVCQGLAQKTRWGERVRATKIPRPTGGARCNNRPPLQSKLAWAEAVAATARRRAIACRIVGV